MRFFNLLIMFSLIVSVVGLADDRKPAPLPLMVVLQQDLRPQVDEKEFDAGFRYLLQELPPDRTVEIFVFRHDKLWRVLAGSGTELTWPPANFSFTERSAATRPYAALLSLLQARRTEAQSILLISNGAMSGTSSAAETPPALPQLVEYCRTHRVRLVGVYADEFAPVASLRQAQYQDASAICSARNLSRSSRQLYHASREGLEQDPTSCDWFREAMHATNGAIYYKFERYLDVFAEILKKEEF
ncbi:MAG: hypothetical protein JXQ27_08040 [Acidobacteria bacterium]|nr:hypothetical protein [Acidobacteriota bacterium]